MSNYAIIGWGSLLWDLDSLGDQVRGDWRIDHGPSMPLEFTRISLKRKGALALVIDLEHGAWCGTSTIESLRSDINQAARDLAEREHTDEESIGIASRDGQRRRGRHDEITHRIVRWLGTTDYAGAVWTDTTRNFESITGAAFAVATAIEYLHTLSDESKIEARRYIANAPSEIRTPLRDAIQEQSWWKRSLLEGQSFDGG